MNEEKEYIIPPRLNKKFTLYGFTIGEIVISLGCPVFGVVFGFTWLIPLGAAVLVTSWRLPTTEKNARDTIRLLYQYYCKPQRFSLRECFVPLLQKSEQRFGLRPNRNKNRKEWS